MPPAPPIPVFSVVIPVMNEAGNILPLSAGIAAALKPIAPYEIIFVDDTSRDTTVAEILQARGLNPAVRLLRHAENRGQSQSLRTGIEAARAPWIITIDGDGQNPPAEIAKLVAALPEGSLQPEAHAAVAVSGLRAKRQDTTAKRYASRAANAIRQFLLKDGCPDTGCGLKIFPRDAYLRLPYFNHMHRYFPTLFKMYGIPMTFVTIEHKSRTIGSSKYTNWQRALVGIFDLIGVMWLQHRTRITRAWEE